MADMQFYHFYSAGYGNDTVIVWPRDLDIALQHDPAKVGSDFGAKFDAAALTDQSLEALCKTICPMAA
jgi:hypothetical protein